MVCAECNYKCLNKDVLSNHLRIHNIFTCEKCDYTSNNLQGINGHSKIHNQKQLKCSKCEVICTTLKKLNNPKRIHIEEISIETVSEGTKTTPSKKTSTSPNPSKMCLSISPEVVDTTKKNKKK